MQSREQSDIYESNDPQNMLHKRIKFCMDMHADAVKALEYPQKEDNRDFGDLDEEKSMKEEDLIASMMEELDDFDMWINCK